MRDSKIRGEISKSKTKNYYKLILVQYKLDI